MLTVYRGGFHGRWKYEFSLTRCWNETHAGGFHRRGPTVTAKNLFGILIFCFFSIFNNVAATKLYEDWCCHNTSCNREALFYHCVIYSYILLVVIIQSSYYNEMLNVSAKPETFRICMFHVASHQRFYNTSRSRDVYVPWVVMVAGWERILAFVSTKIRIFLSVHIIFQPW